MTEKLNRAQIVQRNHPLLTNIDPRSPLSVGNGEFGFSADVTGLQTFPEAYEVPLGTQSNWGWHYTGGKNVFTLEDVVHQSYDTHGRPVPYALEPENHTVPYHWLRHNPHRLQLGRIGFVLHRENGQIATSEDLTSIRQSMNLWEGRIESAFHLDGVAINVLTVCHPVRDEVAVHVESPLLASGRLQVFVAFPSPDMIADGWDENTFPNWGREHRHQTEWVQESAQSALFKRTMDEDGYEVRWNWSGGQLEQTGKHAFTLQPETSDSLNFSVSFALEAPQNGSVDEVRKAASEHWQQFWHNGAAIDFGACTAPEAAELERRVVLSQFLTAVHSGGSLPPQETGYMYNSWYGKFHLEMHWWHAAHFPLWGRTDIMAKSLDWYPEVIQLARDVAHAQGYAGARWPKMVGVDGIQSPSAIATGLIWQQPHPIALAEMVYLSDPSPQTLARYRDVVFESADFMADFAHWDEASASYVLGPPLIPAQENHRMEDSLNPPYELEYWRYALRVAVKWAERLGVEANPQWAQVAEAIAKPTIAEGVYLAHANCLDSFTDKNHDHPSMLGALGLLPGTLIDKETMSRTLAKVMEVWDWDSAWGWDFPMAAMTAARLGERDLAVRLLLLDAAKNTYLPNGHNYQRTGLSAYLPGNGGLLTAVAMMACGWQDNPAHNPGFPQDGRWDVRWEGLNAWL